MKAPSRNISTSLKGQKITARAPEGVEVSGMGGRETMTVPGEGSVSTPPGKLRDQDRSAANFATPMSRVK
jgi:hypothetical protein